jgi:magnesium-transporting ATPase (P-type)
MSEIDLPIEDALIEIGPFFGASTTMGKNSKSYGKDDLKDEQDAAILGKKPKETAWTKFNISQLIISALVFLSVLAWVEFFFYDLRNPPDAPDLPDDDEPISGQRKRRTKERKQYDIISHMVTPQQDRRQRNLAFAIIISIVATMFVIFFNIDWKAVFRTNRKCW